MERKENCLKKLERMNRALSHQEPDRVPISDFFWGSFIKRWRAELGLPGDADPYRYYDLDWMATVPNMDPHIQDFEVLEKREDRITVKTGFEAVITKIFADPMPRYEKFLTDDIEKMKGSNSPIRGTTGGISGGATTRSAESAMDSPETFPPGRRA